MTALEEIKKAIEGVAPDAWRYRLDNSSERYWNYFNKEPVYQDANEIWEKLYSQTSLAELLSTLESFERENETVDALECALQAAVARAEAAEAENKELKEKAALHSADAKTAWAECEALRADASRLQAEIDRKSSMPGDHRYWEGRYRDEAAENEKLRGVVERAQLIVSTSIYPSWHETAIQALASTGGEHNGN